MAMIYIIPPIASSYVGPRDVLGFDALAFWALRAYSAAKATALTPIIDVVKTTDGSGGGTINSLANGNLDVAAIAAFGYGVSVSRIYDQTGNGLHLTQGTPALMPVLTLNAFGSLPGMTFATSASQILSRASAVTQAQPFSSSWVARRTGVTFTNGLIITSNSSALIFSGYFNDATSMMMNAGTFVTAGTTVNNSLNAVHNIFSGAASEFVANGGTPSVVDAGTSGLSSAVQFSIGDGGGASNPGDICEVGYWAGAFSSPNKAALATNEKTYWGIP